MSKASEPILAIVGPTASGKSAIAMELAHRLNGEIVSCDSVQVFRGFAIGCAKPTSIEQSAIRHHLIDVVDWFEPFDAQQYRRLATAAIADIRNRGRRPILCGGTGLYLRALRWGLVEAPPADQALRAELMAEEARSPGNLYNRLRQVDPFTATVTPPSNLVRIVRALEIHALSGQRASELRSRHGFAHEELPLRLLAIEYDSAMLRARIECRAKSMLEAGLIDEVQALLRQGVDSGSKPMRSVGYREACAVVRGEAKSDGLANRIVSSTWAYARRQRTWLRKERGVERWEGSNPDGMLDRLTKEILGG